MEPRPDYKAAVLRGLKKTFNVVWRFLIMIVPCVLAIQIFEKTGLIIVIARWFAPVMSVFGLPGEAALVFISAQFSLFSGIAAATALGLTARQLTIAFAFTGAIHSTFIESAVVKRVGGSTLTVLFCRLVAGVASAMLFNWIL